jgi:alpha-ketoglutarate-dependent 2,4-dichlorophenoxyacetate dioxygenase
LAKRQSRRPGYGVELRGVTLADVATDDAAYTAARAAFEEYSVLVFRGPEVTNDIQLAFSRRFGEPELTKVARSVPARTSSC